MRVILFTAGIMAMIFAAWKVGIIDNATVILGMFISLFAGGVAKKSSELAAERKRINETIRQLKKEKMQLEFERNLHDEEVKRVNEKDYSNMSIDELIAHANERESKRADKTD